MKDQFSESDSLEYALQRTEQLPPCAQALGVVAPGGSTAPWVNVINALMDPASEAFAKWKELELKKCEIEARATRQWNVGSLWILGMIAAAGIAAIFTGQADTGKQLLCMVIGAFGGYGLANARKR